MNFNNSSVIWLLVLWTLNVLDEVKLCHGYQMAGGIIMLDKSYPIYTTDIQLTRS